MPRKSVVFPRFWQAPGHCGGLLREAHPFARGGMTVYLGDMIRPRVYVESAIPSSYFERRTTPAELARRDWTREWWVIAGEGYDLVSSVAVLEEVEEGEPERAAERVSLISALPLLTADQAVMEIVGVYVAHKLMPTAVGGDALHLALASYHRCDFLVTWNYKHLANANKFGHIRRINTLLGLLVPALVTLIELLEEYHGPS
jgi:predicted nucleic acid-binding protein